MPRVEVQHCASISLRAAKCQQWVKRRGLCELFIRSPLLPSDYTPLNSYLHPFAQAHSSQALTTAVSRAFACLIILHQHDDAFPGCLYNFRIIGFFFLFFDQLPLSLALSRRYYRRKGFFFHGKGRFMCNFTLRPVWEAVDLILSFLDIFWLTDSIFVDATLAFKLDCCEKSLS